MTHIKVGKRLVEAKEKRRKKRKQENDRSREPAHALLLLKQVTLPFL